MTGTLLAVPLDVSVAVPPCLAPNFHGIHGQHAIFRPTDGDGDVCALQVTSSVDGVRVVPVPAHAGQLVWLQESAMDDALRTSEYDVQVLDFFAEYSQTVLFAPTVQFSVLYHDPGLGAALVAVKDDLAANSLSSVLPRYWKPSPIPAKPVPYVPVPEHAVNYIRRLLASLEFDPVIASIIDGITTDGLRNDIRYLTNEDGTSGIDSRHSFADGSRVAAAWLKTQFEQAGASCALVPFLQGFAPNVVCKYSGTVDPDSTVLISGHYDSRGSFGFSRAPGGNDDGSGTISLLAIARRIHELGLSFHSSVELVAFAGEEQGLLGSKAYARELRARDANVTLMIQADMLAYHAPHEPPQLGLPKTIGTPEVAELVAKIAAIYSPELRVGHTAACCSDHQSFHEQGYAATQVFERAGPIADPMYHNSGDVSDRPGYDFQQIQYISRVQFATLLHDAGFDLPDVDD